MPATPFDPSAAVVVHSLVGMDPESMELLRPEDFLLVHSCQRAASRQLFEEFASNGDLILAAYYNPQLTYSVSADCLALSGLANYHPGALVGPVAGSHAGALLGPAGLAFINGAAPPFGFHNQPVSRLIYEDPVQEPAAGDLTACSFKVVQKFNAAAIVIDDVLPEIVPPAVISERVPVSLYYQNAAAQKTRVLRMASRAPSAAECAAFFASVNLAAKWNIPWSDHGDAAFPQFPPAGEPYTHQNAPVTYLGAYNHAASAWISSPVAGVTPAAVSPRLVYFHSRQFDPGSGLDLPGVYGSISAPLLLIAPAAAYRPPNYSAPELAVAAECLWNSGGAVNVSAAATGMGFDTSASAASLARAPWEWNL